MILIKDRHYLTDFLKIVLFSGKYDTYKGSTLIIVATDNKNFFMGKYDTYKGSTQDDITHISVIQTGKYDTYKGLTLVISLLIISMS